MYRYYPKEKQRKDKHGQLAPDSIFSPVASGSALTWFIRYILYYNLQLLNDLIIIKTKVLLPQA